MKLHELTTYRDSGRTNEIMECLCNICCMNVVVVWVLQLCISELNCGEKGIQFFQVQTESTDKAITAKKFFGDEFKRMATRLLLQFEDVKVPVVNFL